MTHLLDIYSTEIKTCSHKNSYINIYHSIIYSAPKLEKPKCYPIDKWKSQLWYTLKMDYFSAKNEKDMLFTLNNMNDSQMHYAKWNKTDSQDSI